MGHGSEAVRPEGAEDVFAYVGRLRLLKAWAGNPSLDQLRKSTGFPRSTLFDALNPKRSGLPALDLVRRFVAACGGSADEVAAWSAAWRRIQAKAAGAESFPVGSAPDAGVAPLPPPRQLPAVTRHFVGRGDELKALDALAPDRDPGVPVAVITGTAGVGKTTLAVHWARQVAERFPDGQLYADLRGFSPFGEPVGPAGVARRFLSALGARPEQVPDTDDAQVALYRTLLAGRRLLVLLDNAADSDQVRPLMPGGPGCPVVVTSRDRLTGLIVSQGALPVRLGSLSDAEGHELLAGRLGAGRTAAEPGAAARVVEHCGRLPLAVAVAAARAAADPALRLGTIADELTVDRERLDALATGDSTTDPRTVLSWSYRRLDRPARRLFRLLAVHPRPDIGIPVAGGLAGVVADHARELLGELCDANLLIEQQVGRYVLHDLVRAYAGELLAATETVAERRAALRRLLDHYLHTALPAAHLLHPIQDPIELPPAAEGVTPERFGSAEAAMEWFGTEHGGLVAAVTEAVAYGSDAHAWQLARTLATYLDRRGHWREWLSTQQIALEAARRLGERRAEAVAHQMLGSACSRLGRYADATSEQRHALDVLGALGLAGEQAGVHLNLSSLFDRRGDHDAALDQALRALALYRESGDGPGAASALNNAGWHQARLGHLDDALNSCQEALALFQRHERANGAGVAWDSLGYIRNRRGEHGQAIDAYRRAVELFGELGNRLAEAETLVGLGDTYEAAGDPAGARESWRRAVGILEPLGHDSADAVRTRLRGPTSPT